MTGSSSAAVFEFELPVGVKDAAGRVHRRGKMRRATAADEIMPLTDHRVQKNRAYLVILLLASVITELGDLGPATPELVEGLFSSDFSYLQDFYAKINAIDEGGGSAGILARPPTQPPTRSSSATPESPPSE
ncbi:phage tail assembly protein [Planctomycetota bacterium]